MNRVLLVDDDLQMRSSAAQALELAGFDVHAVDSGPEALALAGLGFDGVVVSDIRMPGMDGMTLMGHQRNPPRRLWFHGKVPRRSGSGDCHPACRRSSRVGSGQPLPARGGGQAPRCRGPPARPHPHMVDLRHRVRAIGASDADALTIGPTGSGKEVVARALHDISGRTDRPAIAINCATLPESLIESDLFGHETTAFPGALRPRYGKFEHARGGTVLLDKIGSMPLDLQAKLLRVLQERVITRLGSNDPVTLDVRFIAISKTDLAGMVARGQFREDLFWCLNVAILNVPPFGRAARGRAAAVSAAGPRRTRYPNARCRPAICPGWPPATGPETCANCERYALRLERDTAVDGPAARLADRMGALERSVIAGSGGRLRPVYKTLGISRKTLYDKMQRHGLAAAC